MSADLRHDQIQRELLAIKGNEELLRPEAVVVWAQRNPDSTLYQCFEWDDAKAANGYRVWQARRLIALHITTEGGERRTIALVIDRSQGGGYRQIDDVVRVPNLRESMLADALAELNRVRRK